MKKYFGQFYCRDDLVASFETDKIPKEEDILFASYGEQSYEGYAFVLYKQNETLFEVSGSHCSCFGLEGQWEPEKTTVAALKLRKKPGEGYCYFLYEHEEQAIKEYWQLVEKLGEVK